MIDVDPVAKELGERFTAAGFELYLVGGVVRDAMLGRTSPDMDLATSAKPHETTKVLQGWADNRYHVGVRFGTVGARKGTQLFEITTFREEVYAEEHRKPAVTFAKDIQTDLSRRDFTINAMAVRLPDGEFVDPFGGVKHLASKTLDTPLEPEIAFSDDPLRMLRAARFVSQLDVTPSERVVRAITEMRERLVDRVRRADPCRAGPAARRREAVGGAGADRRDGSVRPVPPGALRAAARAGPGASAQGRAAPHVRGRGTMRAGPGAPAGRAAARHRQAEDAVDLAGRRAVPPSRGRRRADGRGADEGAALLQPDGRGRPQAGRAPPAVPRVRRRMDRQRRPPLRARRRAAARSPEPADPGRLHHAERRPCAQARAAAGRAGGADRPPGRGGEPERAAAADRRGAGDEAPGDPARAAWSGEALAYLFELRMERGPIPEDEAFELLDAWARERDLGV